MCTQKGEKIWGQGRGSLLEKGIAGDAVQHVVRFSLWGLGQCKDLLLRHAGWDGDVTLVKRVKVLVIWGNRTRVPTG